MLFRGYEAAAFSQTRKKLAFEVARLQQFNDELIYFCSNSSFPWLHKDEVKVAQQSESLISIFRRKLWKL